MFIAELSPLETSAIIGSLVFGLIGCAVGVTGLFKKADVKLEQPVTVELVKALHDQFAGKSDFDKLVELNSERHADLYDRIDKARDISRKELTAEIGQINSERRETLEKLNSQFTYIRESLAALNEKTRQRGSHDR